MKIGRILMGAVAAMGLFCFSGSGTAKSFPLPSTEFAGDKLVTEANIVLGGGCFWCTEAVFQSVKGVISVVSGYAGGTPESASYNKITSGTTGHAEVIKITYNPSLVPLGKLLQVFFSIAHDPTQLDRQGNDVGTQYRSVIFAENEVQKQYIKTYIDELTAAQVFEKPIATKLENPSPFYEAEAYHQDYAKNNPDNPYIEGVALPKVKKLEKEYADMAKSNKEESVELTDMQKHVVLKGGTEPAFKNKYWNHYEEGIYVDVVSGEPLFSSKDKFDSGTGWPSFTKPIEKSKVVDKPDDSLWMPITEVRSSSADSHLGHVFEDGPQDKGGLRYCINSASLRFIAKADLQKEGFGQYKEMFQ